MHKRSVSARRARKTDDQSVERATATDKGETQETNMEASAEERTAPTLEQLIRSMMADMKNQMAEMNKDIKKIDKLNEKTDKLNAEMKRQNEKTDKLNDRQINKVMT